MEKNFMYYVSLPLHKMKNSNMISTIDLDMDVRLGLYYLMSIYGLGYHYCTHGSWEWISISKGEDGKYLNSEEILALEPDMEIYNKLRNEFEQGIFPEGYSEAQEDIEDKNPQVKEFEYAGQFGWLSPTGDYTVSEWGNHLSSAYAIVDKKGWRDEFDEWWQDTTVSAPENDFLCQVKGYVLIHNPSMDGGYIVTNMKPLTKKQREFLYDYFVAIGNIARASMYINEE